MKKRRILKKRILLIIDFMQLVLCLLFAASIDSLSIKAIILFTIINIILFTFTYKSNKYYKYID